MIPLDASRLYLVGFLLVILGALILLAGGLTSASSTSAGGVVFIGPIPIVFGSGPGSGTLVLASLVIAVLMVVMLFAYFLSYWRRLGSHPSNT